MVFECYDCSGTDGFEKGLIAVLHFLSYYFRVELKKHTELIGRVGLAIYMFFGLFTMM